MHVKALKTNGVTIISEPQSPPWQQGRLVAASLDSEGNHMMSGGK